MSNRKILKWPEDYVRHFGMLKRQNKTCAQTNSMLCVEGKSLANFPQMEQLIGNNEEEDYMTFKEAMEIGYKQYKQLNDKQK